MSYSHKGNNLSKIWDGSEEFFSEILPCECPYCSSSELYSLRDVVDASYVSDSLLEYLLRSKIIRKNDYGFEVKNGFPAFVIKKQCSGCEEVYWAVIGMKEIQPQRYQVFLKTNVYVIKC